MNPFRVLALAVLPVLPLAPSAQAAELVVVPSVEYAHQDIWNRTTDRSQPTWHRVKEVLREQPVEILVFLRGVEVDANQNGGVHYRVSFLRPDGSAGSSKDKLVLVPAGPVLQPELVHKAAESIRFVATDREALGAWTAVIEATDDSSGKVTRSEQRFTLAANDALAQPLPASFDAETWLLAYARNPQPLQIPAVLSRVGTSVFTTDGATPEIALARWLGFFEQALAENPWLQPHLIARLDATRDRERDYLGFLFAYATRNDPALLRQLSRDSRKVVERWSKQPWPGATADAPPAKVVEVLRGRYLASGRYQNLRSFLTTTRLAVLSAEGAKQSDAAARLLEPLRQMLQEDSLVRDYCDNLVEKREMSDPDTQWLNGVRQEVGKPVP